jgi:hypothetical protein
VTTIGPSDLITTSDTPEGMQVFTQAIYWIKAIAFQGARVIDAHERDNSFSIFASSARLEEQFFLNACEKAVRWVKVLRSNGGKNIELRSFLPTKALRNFIRTMSSVGIRNLREHEEEYLGKDGKCLEEEIVDASHPDGGLTILVEPGITVLRDEQIIIGGRLNVQETIKLAEALNIELISAQHNYIRKTVSVLKNANPEDYPYIFAPKKIN